MQKAIASIRWAASSDPPARGSPGQRSAEAARRTPTFDASPSRPGSTVSRNEPIALEA